MMRILHVVTTMHRGGLETMLMNYYRKIDTSKIQFDFLTYRKYKSEYDLEILERGGKIYYLPPFSPKTIFQNLKQTSEFFKIHKEYKIVHSHLDALSAFPLFFAKRNNIPVRIAHSHVSGFDIDFKYPVRLAARCALKYIATDFFACSEKAGKFMFGKYAGEKVKILVNAIETNKFAYDSEIRKKVRAREKLGDSYVVGHVGRFTDVKNHEKLLDIFAEILKKRENAVLMLVGKGELEEKITQKTEYLKISDKVRFMGSRDDVNELMQAMDLFILPSKYEGFGMVLIEAQTAGLPCLTSANVVPEDVQVSPLLKYVPLDADSKIWADEGLSLTGSRKSYAETVKEKGYDLERRKDELVDFYQNAWNNITRDDSRSNI